MKIKNLTQFVSTNINPTKITLLFISFLASLILGSFHLYNASAQSDTVSFGDGRGMQMIDPDGTNSIPFWNTDSRAAEFTLYRLPIDRFLGNYPRLSRYSGDVSWDTEGLTIQQTWTATNTVESSFQMWPVLLPKDTPSGIYIIKSTTGNASADSMIVVGRNTLLLKQGNNGQVVAWASALQSGTPAADMEVTLYNIENGAEVAKGVTNEMGVVELNSGNVANVIAIGQTADETTLAATDEHWRNYSNYYWQAEAPENYRIYLYTDRPIYRPGHAIKFDAIVRNNGQDGYSPIAASTVMTATLRDPRNTIVDTVTLESDALGTAHDQFVLGDEPPLGSYSIELQVGDQTQRQELKVEEYRKPEYSVEVSTPENFAILGDTIPVTVDANYFFGQPVADAKVILKVYRSPIYHYWWWWEEDGYTPYWVPTGQVDTYAGTTDSDGRWTLDFEPPSYDNGKRNDARYRIEAEVTDAQEKPISGQSSVQVYWNTLSLNVSGGKYGYRTDEPINLEWQAKDRDDASVANQVIDVRLEKDYYDRDDENDAIQEHQITTNDLGKAALTLENVPQGWYRLLATTTDDKGRQVEARRYLWVYNPTGRDWWFTNNDQISIMVDKESYSVGDTAQLLIQSRVEKGVALLTLEREGVHQEQIVNIDGPMTTVDVPITEDFTPNVFARIHLFKPHSSENLIPNREGEMFTDQVELKVPTNAKRLTVDIRTDAPQYKPGEEATVTIQLNDAGGQPTAGRVTLALVDEAIFELQSDLSANIFDSFYGPGSNRVGIYDSLVRTPYYNRFTMLEDEVAEDSTDRDGEIPSPAPTTIPTEQEKSDSSENSDPRTTFLDTAYWETGIAVGDDGTATVTIPLPDNLTTWRIIVRAVTPETYVGEATENLLVTKEIISRPTMPRFTVLGDVFNLNVVGQNFTGDDLTGEVSIKTDHLVILNDQPSIALNLPDKGSDVAPWTAVASRVGTGMITTTLDTPRGNDTVALPLLTKPFAIPDRWSASGQANPSATETFSVPFNAVHEASELNVRLSPSIALGLLDGLDDLIAYPYGCVEQTMSRVLPSAVAIQVYSELELSNPKATELPAIINKGLQKLYGYQHDDGRWGWFYDDDGGIYLTSYVLLGLTRVQKAGFPVDQAVLDKGFAALDNTLQNSNGGSNSGDPEQRQDETTSNGVLAFAHYVKALGDSFDEADVDKALALADSADSLRADALGLLALALHSYDETAKANALIDVLSSRAEEIGSTAFWPVSEDNWDWYHWRTMASTDKSTAVAVLALSTVRPDSELLPKAVRWLMDHRRGAGWRNTQATAFAVLGLLEYIKVSNELESNYSYTVALNGDEIASGQVTPENVTQPIEPIAIPGDALKMSDNEITISRSAGVSAAALDQQNPLYYTLLLQQQLFYENFAEVSSKDQGLALKRSYSLAEGEKRDDGHYNVGDVVEVTLELEISDEVWYLLVRDPLPAGFEALNENLNPTSYGNGGGFFWRSWGYNRKDVRDDSVDFFITHGWAGSRTFTYRMRATTAGTFSVLPAEAYPMYAEEIWGRSGSMQVSIAPERLDPRPTFVASDVDRNCRIERFDTLQVAGAWGTTGEDGAIHLDDIAEVASLQGSDCMNPAPTASTGELPAGLLVLVPQRQVEAGEEVRVHIVASGAADIGGIEMNLDFDETVLELEEVILNPAMGDDVLQLGPKTDEETGDVLVGAVELPSDDGSTVQASMANAQTVMTVVLKGKADGAVALDISDVQAMDSQGQMMVASSSLVHRDQLDKFIYLPMIAQGGTVQK